MLIKYRLSMSHIKYRKINLEHINLPIYLYHLPNITLSYFIQISVDRMPRCPHSWPRRFPWALRGTGPWHTQALGTSWFTNIVDTAPWDDTI